MEVSALKYTGGVGLHGRSPLLRLQSDERLISLLRRGNTAAFEVLVARYESRLMAFCRHLLGSREDAEDVLQEVMTAAFNAILADDRPINVRPWLYRIARNRGLNHMRRAQTIGVDSMDHHLSEHGATTADKVHEREEFRLLVGDIHELPETQKTALILREMDALSYEQVAEAMETTVPAVKSLLVRARVSLAEAAEARLLSCDHVRIELAEIAEGLQRRPSPLVRRHLRNCKRCTTFRSQLKQTNRALAALLPVGPLAMFHKVLFLHLGHSAASGSTGAASATAGAAGAGAAGAGAAGAGAGAAGAGATAALGTTALAGGATAGSSGLISAGIGAIAGKAAASIAAAALVTAGAVEAGHSTRHRQLHRATVAESPAPVTPASPATVAPSPSARSYAEPRSTVRPNHSVNSKDAKTADAKKSTATATVKAAAVPTGTTTTTTPATPTTTTGTAKQTVTGRTQTQSDPTVLPTAVPPATSPSSANSTSLPSTPTTTAATPTDASAAPPATTTPAGTQTMPTDTSTPPTPPAATTPTTPTATPQPQTTTTVPGSTAPAATDAAPRTLAYWRMHTSRAWGHVPASSARH